MTWKNIKTKKRPGKRKGLVNPPLRNPIVIEILKF